MKHKLFFALTLMVGITSSLFAQNTGDAIIPPVEEAPQDETFVIVEQMPEFPGGEPAMYKYITEHLRYPTQDNHDCMLGTVFVQFVIDTNGNVTHVEKKKGIKGGEMLDKEAVRMIKSMPKWNPGYQNNKPVNVQMILPVKFQIK